MVAAVRGGGTGPAQGELGGFAAGQEHAEPDGADGAGAGRRGTLQEDRGGHRAAGCPAGGPVPGLARVAAGAHRAGRGRDGRSAARPPGGPLLPWLLPQLLLPAAVHFCGQQLLGARLRTADRDAAAGTVEELERIVGRIRKRWPGVEIWLRGDSGFCREDLMAWCEAQGVEYVLGIAQNPRLKRSLAPELEQARQACERTRQAARVFKDFRYRTLDSWSRERRVIGKAEHLPRGANPRFVVTSLEPEQMAARALYEEVCCARGDMENRIKEQQLALFADRTSAQTLRANQLRLYFASFAYTLLELLRRWGLAGTQLARAQCDTIRLKLLKIGVRIRVSVRAVRLSFDEGFPDAGLFGQVLARLQSLPLRC